jgi:glycosyl transferase family 2
MKSPGMSMWLPESSTQWSESAADAQRLTGISIVVTSRDETAPLRRCLETFSAVWANARAQVIVVHAGEREEIVPLVQDFESFQWISAERGTSDASLRQIGFEQTTRDIALFLDHRDTDRCRSVETLCRNWGVWSEAGGRVISAPVCADETSARYPAVSVVMPVHNGGPRFLLALQALALTDLPRREWELIVVDDGSTDESAGVAAQYADKLLRLRPATHGPGYARNRGFELTLGDYIAFINADVMVATDTLRTACTILMQSPELGAIFGSCGVQPMVSGFLSDYRSLVQRYYHQKQADDACTFSSACGIVRSSVFERAGGYDEWHFSRRQLEDLELAQRIRNLGERIVAHAALRATHLRKWTLRRMVTTEILDRTVPWMRLVRRELLRNARGAPSGRGAKRFKIALSWVAVILGAAGWIRHSAPLGISALACVLTVLTCNAQQLTFFARERGLRFASLSAPVDILYYLIAGVGLTFGWIVRIAVGDPTPGPVAEAYAEMGHKRWPPAPVKRIAHASAPLEKRAPIPPAAAADPLLPSEPPPAQPQTEGSTIIQ